jgi:hypothetical protein
MLVIDVFFFFFRDESLCLAADKYPNYSKATKNSERLSHWIRCMVRLLECLFPVDGYFSHAACRCSWRDA